MIEVYDTRVGKSVVVWWKDEVVCPTVVSLDIAISTHYGFCSLEHTGSYATDAMTSLLGTIDDVASLF